MEIDHNKNMYWEALGLTEQDVELVFYTIGAVKDLDFDKKSKEILWIMQTIKEIHSGRPVEKEDIMIAFLGFMLGMEKGSELPMIGVN